MQESRAARRYFLSGRRAVTSALLALGLSTSASRAADRAPPPSFARDVAPILGQWCVNCHGADEQHGGLRLDAYVWVMRGGETEPAVVPGAPGRSLLLAKIERRRRPAMPPRRKLSAPLIARLRAWIAAGAPP